MKEFPKISIITPSYNQEQFLESTILSILDQNYPNLEYVIIDGGSTDKSVDIIRKHEKHLKYWISEKDNGQTEAINKGFSMCTGDVLNWINSDDRLKPDALLSLAEAVEAHPNAGAWVSGCDLVEEEGKYIKTVTPRGLTKDAMADWGSKGHFFQPACFFSRKVWKKFGPLDEGLHYCFDLDFYLKIIDEFDFHGIDAIWAEATIHKDAKTTAFVPSLRAERYIVQARHGYENLAIMYIKKAEELSAKVEKSPTIQKLIEITTKFKDKLGIGS